jgi:hypothetical protein
LPAGADREALLPRERLRAMVQAYYEARGWDACGRVPGALADELDMGDLA